MMRDEEQHAGGAAEAQGGGEEDNPHDQLPSVEEYKANTSTTRTSSPYDNKCRTFLLMSLSLLLLVVAGSIALGVIYGKKDDDNAPPAQQEPWVPTVLEPPVSAPSSFGLPTVLIMPSTQPPTMAPVPGARTVAPQVQPVGQDANRENATLFLILEQQWSAANILTNPSSPQRRAAEWMAHEDPQNLPVNASSTAFRQRYALATFFYATQGLLWGMDATDELFWFSEHDVCDWGVEVEAGEQGQMARIGVDCHGQSGPDAVVRGLSLAQVGLSGVLPPEIVLLENLMDLNLAENEISALPANMAKLEQLQILNLQENALQGLIPSVLGDMTNLKKLNLAANAMVGAVPTTFAQLNSLTDLDMHFNLVSESMEFLKYFPALQSVDLSQNQLYGGILPTVLQALPNLQVLDLNSNRLNGTLPVELFGLAVLFFLDLHDNQLSGEFPGIFENDILRFVSLHDNNLTGNLDAFIPLQQVQHLDLANNSFVGDIPDQMGDMIFLRYLSLAYNENLDAGNITSEFGQLKNLVDLSLQSTNRIGTIPPELGLLQELRMLDLIDNDLTGSIPSSFGGLTNLRNLLLAYNDLDGSWSGAWNMTKLDTVVAQGNNFVGSVDEVCAKLVEQPNDFVMDCDVECSCCTQTCCAPGACGTTVWYSDIDPKDPYKYQRLFYIFNPADISLQLDDDLVDLYDDDEFIAKVEEPVDDILPFDPNFSDLP